MVKPLQRSEIQGFSKGLNTDLNPLNNQLDTTRDEVNFELLRDGTRARRLGFDTEPGGLDFPVGMSWQQLQSAAASTFLWEGAGGDPQEIITVIHIGTKLFFFKDAGTMVLIHTLEHGFGGSVTLRFAAVDGMLCIANGTPTLGLLEYKASTNTFPYSTFRIQIRDQFGIEETVNPQYETDDKYRGPLTWQHYYNLYNQGWGVPRRGWEYGNPPLQDAVLLGSNGNVNGKTPSNSDVVWSGIDVKPVKEDSLENFEAFHFKLFDGIRGADTKASKGFFIIDAFTRGSSRYSAWNKNKSNHPESGNLIAMPAFNADVTTGGPTSIAAHAGRMFYSGCNGKLLENDSRSPNYNNYVFFTQLVKGRQDFSKCYQEGDPTSRESSDIVDTDGGFFSVSGAINIHTMYSVGDQLILIAENGVWSVTGGSGYGFTATNYKVLKLSSFGGIPNKSFVEFGGQAFFWGWDGIYVIAKNQFGDYEVTNLTKDTNDNFFSTISASARMNCQGFADKVRRQVRWVYIEGEPFVDAQTKEIIIDLKFQALYPFTIMQHPSNRAYVIGGVQLGDFSVRYTETLVFVGNEQVMVGNEPVVLSQDSLTKMESSVKYITIYDASDPKIRFCEYNDDSYEDWAFTGETVDAEAYMVTNAFTGGDFAIKKQVPWLTMAFAETEKLIDSSDDVAQESSCIGRVMWNFTHGAHSGKWSRDMQLYRKSRWFYGDTEVDNGFSLNITKTKVRGIGKSFALHVRTEPRKNCHIYGWGITLTVNSVT